MTDTPNHWARGSNQYQKRSKPPQPRPELPGSSLPRSVVNQQRAATGIVWDSASVAWDLLPQSATDRARARFRAALPEYIWDAASLEGNPYTLPEVQTLLEGVTVSGHRVYDQNQILALQEAFNYVDTLVGDGTFALTKDVSDEVHRRVAVHEEIESGHFRGEGNVTGGGLVGLGDLGTYQASPPGEHGETLIDEHDRLLRYLYTLPDAREQAITYFCAATRAQFYFDGNKRTSRLMMAGHLMASGFDAISVSARRRLEYNEHLSTLFDTGDATTLMAFIIDCRPEA
ncbi:MULTISPECIES: hypothetical protein [unclassified Cryobacterium]|uniref:hypothetical protein n=1 Tax=unclassified Cryobacterium TaxID=2649013 RepID=UPI0018E066BA|nr:MULTISPECIES: hypothetical protein [unclassified Cryobacterium]